MNNIILLCVFFVCLKGVFGETISVGDPVTLSTGLTEIPKDEVIEWRFKGILIARVRKDTNPTIYDDALDGNFKGRLDLDRQTGSLTIRNSKTTDTGEYKVSDSIDSFTKTFNVIVSESGGDSGLSGGAIAGIVIGVVLVLCAIAVGIYFGVQKNKSVL